MAIQYSQSEAGPSTTREGQAVYKLSHSLSGHLRGVTALRYTSDGKTLISAGADGYLHFWSADWRSIVLPMLTNRDAERGTHQRSLKCHSTGINDISLSPDDLYIATASDDNSVRVYSLRSLPSTTTNASLAGGNAPLRQLDGHTAPVLSVAFSPKSNLIVTGSFDESAIVWDVQRGEAIRVLPAHADAVWTVGWDPEGVMVLTGSADGLIRLWDANSGQCLKTLDNDTNSPVSFASFTPSSFFLLSSTLSSTLRVYNIHTGKVLKTLRAPSFRSEKYPSPAIVFARPSIELSTNGDESSHESGGNADTKSAWVVAGSETGEVVIWDINSRSVVQVLKRHKSPIVAVAVHPTAKWIATGSLEPEKVIHIWRAVPSSQPADSPGHEASAKRDA